MIEIKGNREVFLDGVNVGTVEDAVRNYPERSSAILAAASAYDRKAAK